VSTARRDAQARALAAYLVQRGGSVSRVVKLTGVSYNFAELLVTETRGRLPPGRLRGALHLTKSPERIMSATLFWICLRRHQAAAGQLNTLEAFYGAYRLFVSLRNGISGSDACEFSVDDAVALTLEAGLSPISLCRCSGCGSSFWSAWLSVRSRCPVCNRQTRRFLQQRVDESLTAVSAAE